MRKNKVLTYLIVAIILSIIIIVFLWLVLRLFHVTSSETNGNAIVLAFFGILATFIVVGNYAQVLNIQKQMDDKLKELERAQNDRINKIEKEKFSSNFGEDTKRLVLGIMKSIFDSDKRIPEFQQFVLALLSYQHQEVLLAAFQNSQIEFQLELGDNTTVNAMASIEEGKLVFTKADTGKKVTKKINKISTKDFNRREANNIIVLYLKLKENKSMTEIFNSIFPAGLDNQ